MQNEEFKKKLTKNKRVILHGGTWQENYSLRIHTVVGVYINTMKKTNIFKFWFLLINSVWIAC